MCGIVGYAGAVASDPGWSRDVFEAAVDTLTHRGPDDRGTYYERTPRGTQIALGHRRLSILDISALGHQPMQGPRSNTQIVYNGEVYNFRELRGELEAHGYSFRSSSDTEVVVAAYDAWDARCVDHFNGMFALAVFDAKRAQIFCARDRIGIKPLYYFYDGQRFAFASELSALLRLRLGDLNIHRDGLANYLSVGYLPGDMTAVEKHFKLLPGHSLTYDIESCQLTSQPYWDPIAVHQAAPLSGSEEELADQLEELLCDAIRQRLISDVPLGAFLSGGIDSSLVVALIAKIATGSVKTFSMGFTVPEADEAPHAKRIAEYLGTEHREMYVDSAGLEEELIRTASLFDEPFADSSSIPAALLSRFTREHVTVALSGDGGDELFFGYLRYATVSRFMHLQHIPLALRRGLAVSLRLLKRERTNRLADLLTCRDLAEFYPKYTSRGGFLRLCEPPQRDVVAGVAEEVQIGLGPDGWQSLGPLTDLMTILPGDYLVKVDRASMASSLEVRVPMLDHRFVEFAAAVPLHCKVRGGTLKYLLRKVLARHLPRELWERPKQGFSIPLGPWFRGRLKTWLLDELTGDWAWTCDLIDRSAVQTLLGRHFAGESDFSVALWGLVTWKLWAARVGLIRG